VKYLAENKRDVQRYEKAMGGQSMTIDIPLGKAKQIKN